MLETYLHFGSICTLQLGVSNGWVWGGHNWVGHIKPIYPLKPIRLIVSNPNPTQPIIMGKPQLTQLPNYQNYQNAIKVKTHLVTITKKKKKPRA